MNLLKHILITTGIILSFSTIGYNQGVSEARPDGYNNFTHLADLLGSTHNFDPSFRAMLATSGCNCSELLQFSNEHLSPALDFLTENTIDERVRIKEMEKYINDLKTALEDKETEHLLNLLKIGADVGVASVSLIGLNGSFKALKIAEGTTQDLILANVSRVIDGAQLTIDKGIGDAKKLSDEIKDRYSSTTDELNGMLPFLSYSGAVLTLVAAGAVATGTVVTTGVVGATLGAGIVFAALASTLGIASSSLNASISNEQKEAIKKFISEQKQFLDDFKRALRNLEVHKNTLFRQRLAILNKCNELKKFSSNEESRSRTKTLENELSQVKNFQSDGFSNEEIAQTQLLENIQIYPNPSQKEVYIDLSAFQIKQASLHLYDSFGKQIFSKRLTIGNINSINISKYANGSYWVTIYFPNQRQRTTQQLIISK